MRHYTANMQKGAAMIDDCLRLLREWQPGESRETFIDRVVDANILGKGSRNRVRDLLARIFFRRFPGSIADNLHHLLIARVPDRDLVQLFLYHTALADDLVYDFITQRLFGLYTRGQVFLDTEDGIRFVQDLTEQGLIDPPWSESITLKTSRGLLAACRDFGLLEGHNRKQFAHFHLSMTAFLYIAYSLADKGLSPNQLVSHTDWLLFRMEEDQVERYLLTAHQLGDLRYETVGGIRRLEWIWHNLSGYIGHVAQGAD